MKFLQHFLLIATLLIANLLFIIATAVHRPVFAAELKAESDAERYVLEQVQKGGYADLETKFPVKSFPENTRRLRGSFIAGLLAGRDVGLETHGQEIKIANAVITGQLDLTNREIPYGVYLDTCRFDDEVILRGSHFAKGLAISNSTFEGNVDFSRGTIEDFGAGDCRFAGPTSFDDLRVSHDFLLPNSTFDLGTSFEGARVGGRFVADRSKFLSGYVSFDDMRVDGPFSARSCAFSFDGSRTSKNVEFLVHIRPAGSQVTFIGAHFADCFLNDSSFEKISTIDFTRMQADFISFDGVKSMTPSEVKLQRMTFKILSPVNVGQLEFLLSHYNAEFYTDLETSWRTHGYPDEADKIFIAKKIAERQEHCSNFFSQCDSRGAWAWSYFQDKLAGYGKRLQRLLYWSLAFLLIGILVFRSERGMRIKDPKDAPHHAGRYNAFWYSLDLFLPIIKLGEADVWTPKDDRRWANLYRRVHIIIGSLFVPIGLAAWTGIIK